MMEIFEENFDENLLTLLKSKHFYCFIGDIHGSEKALKEALLKIEKYRKQNKISKSNFTIVFLGDYIDRGPKPNEVLLIVREYVEKHKAIALIGNHDDFLLRTADSEYIHFEEKKIFAASLWDDNQGFDTVQRMYGYKKVLPKELLDEPENNTCTSQYRSRIKNSWQYDFIKNKCKLFFETENMFISHSPQSYKEYDQLTLIWGRKNDYKNGKGIDNFIVPNNKKAAIHGHIIPFFGGEKGSYSFFPQIHWFHHGGHLKFIALCDAGCSGSNEVLHPVIISEKFYGDDKVAVEAIL